MRENAMTDALRTVTLNPCPFCSGGTRRVLNDDAGWHVWCVPCDARGPSGKDRAEAITFWNCAPSVAIAAVLDPAPQNRPTLTGSDYSHIRVAFEELEAAVYEALPTVQDGSRLALALHDLDHGIHWRDQQSTPPTPEAGEARVTLGEWDDALSNFCVGGLGVSNGDILRLARRGFVPAAPRAGEVTREQVEALRDSDQIRFNMAKSEADADGMMLFSRSISAYENVLDLFAALPPNTPEPT